MAPRERSSALLEALANTALIYGRDLPKPARLMLLADLDAFTDEQVIEALNRCRMELRNFPTVADIVDRIDDGRPGPEEAWALLPKSEADSVVWCDEMAEAFGACRALLESDPVAARMAFRETYSKLLGQARASRRIPKWTPSFGSDASGRGAALKEAVMKKRLTEREATLLLPHVVEAQKNVAALIEDKTPVDAESVRSVKEIAAQVLKQLPAEARKAEVAKRAEEVSDLPQEEIEARVKILRAQAAQIRALEGRSREPGEDDHL